VAITYAEAGGWGRALMLEARRRRIPTVGLQHGFIYRHWLNYLHEPDEMMPDPGNGRDAGFPRPTRTLLFDDYAARHLVQAGGFPTDTLAVTGSPRLDALASQATALRPEALQHARRMAGAEDSQALVTVFTKWREASHLLPALVAAVAARPDIHLVIKTHPAEISEAYSAILGGATNVRILGANAPLAPLIRVSRAIVTVNSTVALDAAVMQVPTLVLGRSGNLQPFVDDGLLVGAPSAEALPETLTRILYDEEFRRQLAGRQRALLANYGMRADGRAAARAADAILDLVESDAAGHSKET
jgi:UDP-N-acetylglucosamine 2-epimerase